MHTPYTYLIKCIPTGEVYYGVRFSKKCHPNDLWKSYFTSSQIIKRRIKQYGKEAFLFEVRKIFANKQLAISWEEKVLRRLDIRHKPHWLNHCIGQTVVQGSGTKNSVYGRKWFNNGTIDKLLFPEDKPNSWVPGRLRGKNPGKLNGNYQGKSMTPEHRKAHSRKMKGKLAGSKNPFYGKKHSPETLKLMSDKITKWKPCTDGVHNCQHMKELAVIHKVTTAAIRYRINSASFPTYKWL